MDWLAEPRDFVLALLDRHGLVAAGLLVLVEEAGVPLPLPGDLLMVLLGMQARQGRMAAWQVVVTLEAATVVGAFALYAVARWAGRPLVERYGRVIGLTAQRLDRAERRLERHGAVAVGAARLVPGMRVVTAAACGVLRVPVAIFAPGLVGGSLTYILIYVLLGYAAGPAVPVILAAVESVIGPIAVVAGAITLAAILALTRPGRRRLRHLRRLRSLRPPGRWRRRAGRTGARASGPTTTPGGA